MNSGNIQINIDLTKFWGTKVTTTRSGENVIVIPIDTNHLIVGKKGGIFASLIAKPKKQTGQYGETHYIKPNFSKQTYRELTQEQMQNIPFIGRATVYEAQPQNGYTPKNQADTEDSIF